MRTWIPIHTSLVRLHSDARILWFSHDYILLGQLQFLNFKQWWERRSTHDVSRDVCRDVWRKKNFGVAFDVYFWQCICFFNSAAKRY